MWVQTDGVLNKLPFAGVQYHKCSCAQNMGKIAEYRHLSTPADTYSMVTGLSLFEDIFLLPQGNFVPLMLLVSLVLL